MPSGDPQPVHDTDLWRLSCSVGLAGLASGKCTCMPALPCTKPILAPDHDLNRNGFTFFLCFTHTSLIQTTGHQPHRRTPLQIAIISPGLDPKPHHHCRASGVHVRVRSAAHIHESVRHIRKQFTRDVGGGRPAAAGWGAATRVESDSRGFMLGGAL